MNDAETARALYRSFIPIMEHYENPCGWSGTFKEADFDYWRFLGHELLVSLIAPLLTEERYEIITDLLAEPLTVRNAHLGDGKPVDYTYASEWLRSFEKLDQEHRKISYHGHLLHERHAGPLADVLPLQDFLAADYLLFLRGELAKDDWEERGVPWGALEQRLPPRGTTLHPHRRPHTDRAELATTLGAPDVATLKERLTERAGKLAPIWSNVGRHSHPLTRDQIEGIGTK
ncbi:MAG TPA: hypothetical protein VEU30_07195 [Thermoanaerobaculia bacterium]|nr:hypothetical protein [Thermoanaerobaculia bacterium]